VATLLESVSVTAESVCPARPDRGQAMALLDQARDGLLATVVARETKPGTLRTVIYERVLDVRTARPVSQTVRARAGTGSRPFLAPHPASTFATSGFMQEDEGGRTFDGPDADVLLDPSFAITHCFRIQAADAEHPEQVGLAFSPAPGRDALVDVSGVLWIDRATPALRSLDFRYTGLEPAAAAAGAGGSLVFRALPNGVVVIERWSIRMAALSKPRASPTRLSMPNGPLRSQQYDVIVNALRETGGEVVSASWPDGTRWQATMGQVSGRVVAHGTGRPIGSVRVWLDGLPDTTVTDGQGSFTFRDVLPGPYALWANDSSFTEFGISNSRHMTVEVPRGAPLEVTVELQSRDQLLNETCQDERIDDSTAVLLGRVVRGPGTVVNDGARVDVEWNEILAGGSSGGVGARVSHRSGRVDDNGRFEVCGVRRNRSIAIKVTRPGGVTQTVTLRIPPDQSSQVISIHFP
jgi:hypothetical protein